jgi:hypothetical protein
MRFNRSLLLNIIFLVLVSFISFSQDLELSEKEFTELNIQRLEIEAKIGSISEKIKKMEKEILYSREVVPSPLINEYKSELLKLETQLKKELMTYREKHPVIKKIQTQIDVYENKLKEEIEKTSEKKIYSQNPEYMELVSELNRFETENAGLGARIEEIAKIIDEEKKKIEEKKVLQQKENIRQATQEIEVDNSKDIDSLKKMGLIIVLVILCSILFYIFKHIKTKKNKSEKGIKDNNILGTIKNITMKDSESGISSEAVLINDPDNEIKKSIRVIAEKISQRTKTFAVTSLESSTGKTFISVNLASYWANKGEKTLIIDTNFKQPKIHRIFMKENDTGIADLLIGILLLRDIIRLAVMRCLKAYSF